MEALCLDVQGSGVSLRCRLEVDVAMFSLEGKTLCSSIVQIGLRIRLPYPTEWRGSRLPGDHLSFVVTGRQLYVVRKARHNCRSGGLGAARVGNEACTLGANHIKGGISLKDGAVGRSR